MKNSDDTFKPNEQTIVQQATSALDHANESLPEGTLNDLAHVRQRALLVNKKQGKSFTFEALYNWLTASYSRMVMPIAATALIVLTIQIQPNSGIPELPSELVTQQIPSEDLNMLQELEFVAWLAENEQSKVL